MDRNQVLKLIVIGGFSFGTIILFVSFLFFYIISSKSVLSENSNVSSYDYQYYQQDTLSGESIDGITSLSRKLEENEYLNFHNENSVVLISNIGSPQYECTGTCYCMSEEEERRYASAVSSSVLTRTLITLVVAVSSVFATDLAREYFEEQCADELGDSCPVMEIRSQVRKCKRVQSKPSKPKRNYAAGVKYSCRGGCLINPKLKNEKAKELAEEFACEKVKTQGFITLSTDISGYKSGTPKSMDDNAKLRFIKETLQKFCKDASETEYTIVDPKTKRKVKQTKSLCVANVFGKKNPTVRCKEKS